MTLRIAVSLFVLTTVWLDAAPCTAARVKWWQSQAVVNTLGLTRTQIDGIERTFEETRPNRLQLQHVLDDLESALRRAIDNGEDATATEALVARVESARMAHNIARTMMLIRMYRFLTPEQRTKLRALRQPDLTPARALAEPALPQRSSHDQH